MKSKTSLIGAQGRVELYTISLIDLHLVLVVLPNYTKLYDSLRYSDNLKSSLVFGVFFEEGGVLESGDKIYGRQ